jgi:iron complex transport system ATP-binding protein
MHAISAENVSFCYQGRNVLKNLSFDIRAGKLTIILGRNGSGKSTLLRLLAGFLPPAAGRIVLMGQDLHTLARSRRARLLGFLAQQHHAVFPFSVFDVVLTGRASYVTFTPGSEDRSCALAALEQVGISHLHDRPYTELSGGEQQLVMIARVLAQKPQVILLDEPTSHLDFCNQARLLELMKKLVTGSNLAILAVLHDPNIAFLYGDDFLFLKEGRIFRPANNGIPWDAGFIKEVYGSNLQVIPYRDRGLVVPDSGSPAQK